VERFRELASIGGYPCLCGCLTYSDRGNRIAPQMSSEKFCTKCRRVLPIDRFKKRRTGYYESWCRACTYQSRKKWFIGYRKRRAAERLAVASEWRRKNYATYTLMILKKRARDKRLPFNLEISDLMLPDACPVLGIKLMNNRGKAKDNSPSVDRIAPSLGYTKGNVCIISHRANMLKNSASVAELEAILKYVKSGVRARG